MINPSDPGAAVDSLGRLLNLRRRWDGTVGRGASGLDAPQPQAVCGTGALAGSSVMSPEGLSIPRERVPPSRKVQAPPTQSGLGEWVRRPVRTGQGTSLGLAAGRSPESPKMTPGALGLEIQVRGPRASDGAVSWRKRHLPFDWENWRCPPATATAPHPLGLAASPGECRCGRAFGPDPAWGRLRPEVELRKVGMAEVRCESGQVTPGGSALCFPGKDLPEPVALECPGRAGCGARFARGLDSVHQISPGAAAQQSPVP